MTFREKLKIDHPERISGKWIGGYSGCPPTKDYSKTIMDIVTNTMKMKDMRIDLYFGDSGITCNICPYNKD